MAKNSLDLFFKIKKEDVAFATVFLEAYQYYFTFRTPEPARDGFCRLHIMVSPDFVDEFEQIMLTLAKEIVIERVI